MENITIEQELYNWIYYINMYLGNREIVNFTLLNKKDIKTAISIIKKSFDFSYYLEFAGLKEIKEYFNL